MEIVLDYKSDLFFKYCFGRNTQLSMILRQFMLKHILDVEMDDIRIDNPELFVMKENDKVILLDMFMSHGQVHAGMEMQKTALSPFLRKRFQYYGFKAVVVQMLDGEKNYGQLREYHQIIFIDDQDEDHPSLLNEACIRYEDGKAMAECIVYLHYVNLKSIKEIAKGQDKLSEFEAVIYLIEEGQLEGIEYEDKEGVVGIMEQMRESFRRSEEMMTMIITEEEKRKLRQMELKMGIEEGIEEGKKEGVKEGVVETVNDMIEIKYHCDAREWVSKCSKHQLDMLKELLCMDLSYEELKNRIVETV